MSKWYLLSLGAVVAALASLPPRGSAAEPSRADEPAISADRIRAHVKYLASDRLEGRGLGGRGEELATAYLTQEFKNAGLKPAGERGTFFQTVPLLQVTTDP